MPLQTDRICLWSSSMLELSIGFICSCMPVITIFLKGLVEKLMVSWGSIKRYSGTIFSGSQREERLNTHGEQLPEIPTGALSGIKTFIRRLHRSHAEETALPMTEMSAFSKLGSIDEGYHEQLRAINSINVGHFTSHRDV